MNRKLFFNSLLLVVALFIQTQAVAAAGIVFKPGPASPAVVTAGGWFDVFLQSGEEVTVLRMEIRGTDYSADAMNGPETFTKRTKLTASVPADIAPGLYDFLVYYEAGGEELVEERPESVFVPGEVSGGFRFVVLSDFHEGNMMMSEITPGLEPDVLRAEAIRRVNEEHPEFVLLPGDMTAYPPTYEKDFPTSFEKLTTGIDAPIFTVPGNHDQYSASRGITGRFDGRRMWMDFYGPVRQAFTYGGFRFIGINTYSWPVKYRDLAEPQKLGPFKDGPGGVITGDEYEYLKTELEAAVRDGLQPVVFGHHSPSSLGDFEGTEDFTATPETKLLKLLADNGVKYYIHGHNHSPKISEENGLTIVCAGTSGGGIDQDGAWTYAVFDVDEDGEANVKIVEFLKAGELP